MQIWQEKYIEKNNMQPSKSSLSKMCSKLSKTAKGDKNHTKQNKGTIGKCDIDRSRYLFPDSK